MFKTEKLENWNTSTHPLQIQLSIFHICIYKIFLIFVPPRKKEDSKVFRLFICKSKHYTSKFTTKNIYIHIQTHQKRHTYTTDLHRSIELYYSVRNPTEETSNFFGQIYRFILIHIFEVSIT